MTSDEFARTILGMEGTLYRVCCTHLSCSADREDAVQETLRRAWEKRARLRDERYLRTWVIRILLNVCRDMQRNARRVTPMDELPETPAPTRDTRLTDALGAMEEKLRTPIVLHYLEGFSVEEIAAILHLPQGTVKSRMNRGRSRLRELLSEEVFDE